jgi:cell division protein FtsI (penicillin-binding protein 3)
LFIFGVISVRAALIHLTPHDSSKLKRILKNQYKSSVKLAGIRGSILDRKGRPLALSVDRPSYFVDPRIFNPSPAEVVKLGGFLNLKSAKITKVAARKNHFAWLSRKVLNVDEERVSALRVRGLNKVYEPARHYPMGEYAAAVIGYVGIDNHGLGGLERMFDSELSGPSQIIRATKDARGRLILDKKAGLFKSGPGLSIILTLDQVIQDITESALEHWVINAKSKGGFALVLDPHSGDILAAANYPRFNPNAPLRSLAGTRNQAISDTFEPGSVIKPFVAASALELGLISMTQQFDCNKGVGSAGGVRFRDSHAPPTPTMSVVDTVVHSSNVCTYEIAKTLGPKRLEEGLQKFGFGGAIKTRIFPGQEFGTISPSKEWRPIRFANISFGQGMTASGLEIARAYSIIANGGFRITPRLVKTILRPDGSKLYGSSLGAKDRLLSAETVSKTKNILRAVVEQGAVRAKTRRYSTAGKTGTSQKIDPSTRGYSRKLHRALFAGFAPAEQPQITVVVVIDEPGKEPHYGAVWAAPAFAEIVEQTLSYLNTKPDKDEVAHYNNGPHKRMTVSP